MRAHYHNVRLQAFQQFHYAQFYEFRVSLKTKSNTWTPVLGGWKAAPIVAKSKIAVDMLKPEH